MNRSFVWLVLLLTACGSTPEVQTIDSATVAQPIRYEDAPTGAIQTEPAPETPPPLAAEPEPLPVPVTPPPPPPAVPSVMRSATARGLTLQPPVWIEREGVSTAVKAGLDMYSGDRIRTGAGGRLQLTLEDGSMLKLGENAELTLDELKVSDGNDGLLRATFNVLKGAFRYTATTPSRFSRREVAVNLNGIYSAALQSADIWGKTGGADAALYLLEGRVEVTAADGALHPLDQPRQSLHTKAGAQQPLETSTATAVSKRLATTEPMPARGLLTADGRYSLALSSELDLVRARTQVEKLWKAGYPAEVFEVQIKDKTWHRLVIRGFATEADAKAFKPVMATLGYKTAWLLRPNT